MTDLAALLTVELDRMEASLADAADAEDVILEMPATTSMACTVFATITEPDPGVAGPTVIAHADVTPGGRIAQARVEAREGDRTLTVDVEPGTGLHTALAIWFRDIWDSWDEVPEGTPGEVLGVPASDLRPGDEVVRLGLTVAGIEGAGVNTAGEPLLSINFQEVEGVEVYPEGRSLTIIRPEATR